MDSAAEDRYGPLGARAVEGPVHRIVSSRFPPTSLFDAARNAEELEMLAELEGLTNDRLRQELGDIRLVAKGDGLYGPGTTPVMAAFCHPAPSRFSDGSFGLYYAALREETAILETVHHRERFLRDAGIPKEAVEMRRYVNRVVQPMTLLPRPVRAALLDPDDYGASQAFGAAMRRRNAWGLYYNSVRHTPEGRCVGVLRPRALTPAAQASHYRYWWNGTRIEHVEKIESFVIDR